ncbi:fibronectin type III-like domain-contianing protein [Paenibacillus chitinolyticus]
MPGKEVVQVYVHQQASVIRPIKELKKFTKVSLQPGEKKQLHFELTKRDFAFYNVESSDWLVETGYFEILIGGSLDHLPLKATIHVASTTQKEYVFTRQSLTKEWLEDTFGKKLITAFFSEISKELNLDDEYTIAFLREMPVSAFISLFGQKWMETHNPEKELDKLIQQINEIKERENVN